MKTVYVDLDGVMTDFYRGYKQVFGVEWLDIPISTDRWKNINNTPGYFENLPLKDDALELWDFIDTIPNIHVRILTSTGWNEERNGKEKRAWCLKNLGVHGHNVITVTNINKKHEHAHKEGILIDDHEEAIDLWIEAGGDGILHRNASSTIYDLSCRLIW